VDDPELRPEEEEILAALADAWQRVPPAEQQPFLILPWGDSIRTLSHPGLPNGRLEGVPWVRLQALEHAGLIALTPEAQVRRGSVRPGTVILTPRGRAYRQTSQPPAQSVEQGDAGRAQLARATPGG